MKYMPILPLGMLDVFTNFDAFILPQFWNNEEYSTFYRRNVWDTVIIDNAMYEQKDMFDFKTMINIAKLLRAKQIFLVVLEDPSDPYHTVQLACDCISEFKPNGWKPMTILHGDPKAVSVQFNQLKLIPNMGFGIAVSLWRAGFKREDIFRENKMDGYYVHAMGLDDIDEIPLLRNAGFKSVDSSIAATAAWNNINLQKERKIVRTGAPDDAKRVSLTHPTCSAVMKQVVKKNIALINTLCEG